MLGLSKNQSVSSRYYIVKYCGISEGWFSDFSYQFPVKTNFAHTFLQEWNKAILQY